MAVHQIEQDVGLFRAKLRQVIKDKGMKKYLATRELFGRQGQTPVSIPIPELEHPHFRHGHNVRGIGQGEGQEGNVIVGPEPGTEPGTFVLEDSELRHLLLELLLEDVELPYLVPSVQGNIETPTNRSRGLQEPKRGRPVMPVSYKRALRRVPEIAEAFTFGDERVKTDALTHVFAVMESDKAARYHSAKPVPQPFAQADVFYMLDTSGSMTFEKKERARIISSWLSEALVNKYQNRVLEYWFTQEVGAHAVDKETALHTRESGGTNIAKAYSTLQRFIRKDPRLNDPSVNRYFGHFTDGEDTVHKETVEVFEKGLLPVLRVAWYAWLPGTTFQDKKLRDRFQELNKEGKPVIVANVESDDDIGLAVAAFIGKRLPTVDTK